MKTRPLHTLIFLIIFLFISHLHGQHQHSHACPSETPEEEMRFVENRGQWHQNVIFRTSLGDLNGLFLEDKSFTYLFHDTDDSYLIHDTYYTRPAGSPLFVKAHAYKVNFLNALDANIQGSDKLTLIHNYFHGDDESKWASNCGVFHKIVYENIYEQINLEAYSQGINFKYDFVVNPGAAIADIQLEYEGVEGLHLKDGHLIIPTSVETITEFKPYAYQLIDGEKQTVACNYILQNNILSFEFPEGYDQSKTLVIDPTVIAATLTGTITNKNFGHTATFDNSGNIYTGGISFGSGYPTTSGAFQLNYAGGATDVCISKYNPTGTDMLYATYIGGSSDDIPHSIVADFSGQLYIYGSSMSIDYPTTTNAFQSSNGGQFDIIVTKLNPTGSALVGSTFVGGDGIDGQNTATLYDNYGDQFRGEIILDAQGNPYVASNTQSADFPASSNAYDQTYNPNAANGATPAQDAVIFKLNSDLSTMFWGTFLGGDDTDTGAGLRLDDFNNVYVTGIAGAANFPTTPGTVHPTFQGGLEDAYVAKISADGSSLLRATFWGTDDVDHGMFMDIDEQGNVHIYGQTKGDLPVQPAGTFSTDAGSQQFLTAFDKELSTVVYSTVIGLGPTNLNQWDFAPVAFMIDKCNNIYFSGYYASPGLPTTPDAISTAGNVFYLGVLEPNATALSFGTYYGASDHVDGGTSRFDKSGTVYQGVCSCNQGGVNNILNTTPDAWATTQTTACDVGVFKIDFEVETVTAAAQALPGTSGCAPFDVNFLYTGQDATDWEWDFGDNSPISNLEDPSHTFADDGTYIVRLIASSQNTCNVVDTFYIQIDVLENSNTAQSLPLCTGSETVYLDASVTNGTYVWQDGSTSSLYSVTTPGSYWVEVSIPGCSRVDTFHVVPASNVIIDLGNDIQLCDQPSVTINGNTPGAEEYEWSTGSDNNSITVSNSGTYWLSITDDVGCVTTDTIEVMIGATPNIELGAFPTLCDGESVILDPNSDNSDVVYLWQDQSTGSTFDVFGPGVYSVTVSNNGCPNTDEVTIDYYEVPDIAYTTANIVCSGECNGFIESTIINTAGPLTFEWDNGSTTQSLTDLCEGAYALTITDQNGCTYEEFFEISNPDPLAYESDFGPVICFGEGNGFIEITTISGGFPPYSFSLNGGPSTSSLLLDSLSGGVYELEVSDLGGCTLTEIIEIYEPPFIHIFAGDDRRIELGDTVHVNGFVFPSQDQIISWDPLDYFWGCEDCPEPEVQPVQTISYMLTVEDSITGCLKMDTVLIQVDKTRKIYIPNAFTPNGDGINDYFMIYSGPGISEILSFKIYDRWGEQLFQELNFQPNDRTYGWDGQFKGQDMNNGVFVYVAEVAFIDGVKILYSGDVTLLR